MFAKIKESCHQLSRPFNIVRINKMTFFLWASFTLFGGLLGIVVSITKHALFGDYTLPQAIYLESRNGAIYTYSIAMLASVLSSVFINFAEQRNLEYKRYKIPLITLSIFALIFGGVFYALGVDVASTQIDSIPQDGYSIDWKQLSIFIIAVIMSVYSFCVCRLDLYADRFTDIKDNTNNIGDVPTNINNYKAQ